MTFANGDDLDWEFAFVRTLGIRPAKPEDLMSTKRKKRVQDLPVLHPDAAGIDVGANELFVAVPAGRDSEPVRSFRDIYKRPSCPRRLVTALPHSIGRDGIHQCLLDTDLSDSRNTRH